jgi:hypothetical protein
MWAEMDAGTSVIVPRCRFAPTLGKSSAMRSPGKKSPKADKQAFLHVSGRWDTTNAD